ncbi:hypothetical protein GQ44DRAFT_571519, partial [Phaeosphaeriaceae sp. PMI808]
PGAESNHQISQREPTRQALFQRKANEALSLPNGYLDVAVLIMRWDESIDDFKGHTEEIDRLQSIFENQYNYKCRIHSIQNTKNPQIDLNLAVLKHIEEYDDPNNLNQNFTNTGGDQLPAAFWKSAEEPIRLHMKGDALSILDCCMASLAGINKCGNGPPRTYQLLAASAANALTAGPGQNSFTNALCESLTELPKESVGGTFLLNQLCERINTKRMSHACLSWDRLQTFKRTIQLGRLEKSLKLEDSFHNEPTEQSSLLLRFSFKKNDLEDKKIENLAEQVVAACHEADAPIRRVDWVRM